MTDDLDNGMNESEEHTEKAGKDARLPAEPRAHHRHERHVAEPHRLAAERQACPGARSPHDPAGHHRTDQRRQEPLEAEPADRPGAGYRQPSDGQQGQSWPP